MSEIHSSGHANQEELKLMIRLFKPRYFVPYHGEFRMLKKHTDLGVMCGIPRRNTFVLENGDVLLLIKDSYIKMVKYKLVKFMSMAQELVMLGLQL